jgi:protein-L-isoaspartate(D-aspartate) O-methyltransferase
MIRGPSDSQRGRRGAGILRRLGRPALMIFAAAAMSGALLCAGRDEDRFARLRRDMIDTQLRGRDITDKRVLESMAAVPRHLFVPPSVRDAAYEDHPLPIAEGQTISQPYIVALMTQGLELKGKEKVLEVGTGSGYQAAVLSRLAGGVFSIEINGALAAQAAGLLRRLGCANVEVRKADGFFGWPERAPFDGIIVTCAAAGIPEPLFEQLAEGGRLMIPIGEPDAVQVLTRVRKIKGRKIVEEILDVRFVPMTGENLKKKK